MKPNNVTRMLEAKGIKYQAFELPAEKLGAEEAAEILGVPPDTVYKTIVVTRAGRGKHILALVPGSREVDLKALAIALGEKKVYLPTQREAEKITGLQAGGISPLALINRGFDVILDASAQARAEIFISGGQRGLNICIPVNDLSALTNAKIAAISH
jgi:Cys-tRNA(Pro)/Cys-tRNA(Cys) deacylase